MQANDRNPPQNPPITVIDLTDDPDDDDYEFELLESQSWKNTPKSTLEVSEENASNDPPLHAITTCMDDFSHTTVIEDSIQSSATTSGKEIFIHDTKTIDIDAAKTTNSVSADDFLATKDDTTDTGNEGVPVMDIYDSSTNGESATITDGDDGETTYYSTTNETEDVSRTTKDTTMDVNATGDTPEVMDEMRTDMDATDDTSMVLDDTTITADNEHTNSNTSIVDTAMDTDNINRAIETEYQSYSLYHYDWTNNSATSTCLASTQDRYNTTTTESLALDQSILNKSTNPYVSNRNKTHINNFFKSCQWSPDGACLLTSSEDRVIRLFDVPSSIYDPSHSEPLTLTPSLGILQGESICDMEWFPSMNSQDPATCCFLSSVRDHPVHLWDATTGKVRASYCVVDHQERFIGPNVLKFNLDGTKIYCGYENMIEIFDVHAPGNNTSTKQSTTPQRKSRKGQKGIISCLDFNPDRSGMYAAGSYSQSIGIYDERTNELCLKLTGMKGGGVTQVKFSADGYLLYSASRQSNTISCWDVRQSGNILYELDRKGKTNQRISFDLDPTGSVLITGDQDGHVLAYDLTTTDTEDVATKARLLASWDAHEDIVSGATFNPGYPSVMATCSGQRKFEIQQSDDDSDTESMVVDNKLKIWQLAGRYEWYSMNVESAGEGMELDTTQ